MKSWQIPIFLFLAFSFFTTTLFAQKKDKKKPNQTAKTIVNDSIFSVVEQMPRFPTCENDTFQNNAEHQRCAERELLKFVYTNIKYPAIARDSAWQGTAVVTFVVEKDGSLSNIKMLRDPQNAFGQEVMRVVQIMNDSSIRWIPAKRANGEIVRLQYNLPVRFRIEDAQQDSSNQGQNLFMYYVFCRDFTGDFFQKDFFLELSAQPHNGDLCEQGIKLAAIKIDYVENDTKVSSAAGSSWEEVRKVFEKASIGGAFHVEYTLTKNELFATFTKVLMVE